MPYAPDMTHAHLLAVFTLVGAMSGGAFAQPDPDPAEVATLFDRHCTMCHAGSSAPVGVRLDSLDAALEGGDRGPVIVPDDPEASELIARVRGTSTPRMPLTGPPFLDDAQIDLLVAWIAAGAPTEAANARDATDDRTPSASEDAPGSFAAVASLLQARCAYCHRPDGVMGAAPEGLVLTDHASIFGSTERPVVVPGAPLASELFRRVAGLGLPRMPFDGPPYLDEAQIASIRQWIEDGAPGPDGSATPVPAGREVRLNGTLDGRWSLDGLTLIVTDATRLDDAPGPGDRVEVRGVLTEDGRVRATRIRTR